MAHTSTFSRRDLRLIRRKAAAAASSIVANVLGRLLPTQSPIHRIDLLTRVANLWGFKAGQRIQERILSAATLLNVGFEQR